MYVCVFIASFIFAIMQHWDLVISIFNAGVHWQGRLAFGISFCAKCDFVSSLRLL